ncbi:recombination protein O N-terminal domain-containing protein [Candidatus Gracilibacteria bacterium]|nr:recombination protein O N-terminal domain-containing protein [Candidatus Gracilibacteria bacterium]
MFRVKAIIIHKQKIRDGQIRVVIFTKEFGKITAWHKKQICPGIGSMNEIHIERNGGQNHIKNIETIQSISGETWKYEEVIEFLRILQTLYELLPDSSEHITIYEDIEKMLFFIQEANLKIQTLFLTHIRILKKLGSLKEEIFSEVDILRYIYINIDKKSMESILGSNTIDEMHINILKKAVEESRYSALI